MSSNKPKFSNVPPDKYMPVLQAVCKPVWCQIVLMYAHVSKPLLLTNCTAYMQADSTPITQSAYHYYLN